MTNGDNIRSMTDEELSKFLSDLVDDECSACPAHEGCKVYEDIYSCREAIEGWLEQETE